VAEQLMAMRLRQRRFRRTEPPSRAPTYCRKREYGAADDAARTSPTCRCERAHRDDQDSCVDAGNEALGRTRRTDPVLPGAGGNARLTAWTGLLLLVLFIAATFTLIAALWSISSGNVSTR